MFLGISVLHSFTTSYPDQILFSQLNYHAETWKILKQIKTTHQTQGGEKHTEAQITAVKANS